MASIQHTVDLLDKTTAFGDLERSYWRELLPSMNRRQLGQFTQILEGHETRLAAFKAKYGHREIQDWEAHLSDAAKIREALRPGAATILLSERLYA